MDVVIYSDLRNGCGRYHEFVCTSDDTCLPDFDDRTRQKRYAVVYLGHVHKGYCIHCIEEFFRDIQYLENRGTREAKIQIGRFRSVQTVAAARAFIYSALRKYRIKHREGMVE